LRGVPGDGKYTQGRKGSGGGKYSTLLRRRLIILSFGGGGFRLTATLSRRFRRGSGSISSLLGAATLLGGLGRLRLLSRVFSVMKGGEGRLISIYLKPSFFGFDFSFCVFSEGNIVLGSNGFFIDACGRGRRDCVGIP